MIRISCTLFILCSLFSVNCHADSMIWSGPVKSDGTSTPKIKLVLGQKYQIKVSGTMNLGLWWKGGEMLKNDACYEFNDQITPDPLSSFKNSLAISVCDGKYHANHFYESLPFVAAQSGIHFWINDTNYEDNSGELEAQVILIDSES